MKFSAIIVSGAILAANGAILAANIPSSVSADSDESDNPSTTTSRQSQPQNDRSFIVEIFEVTNYGCEQFIGFGVIINDNFAITAADCSDNADLVLYAGRHGTRVDKETAQKRKVDKFIVNKKHEQWRYPNNVALLFVQEKFVVKEGSVKFIKLPNYKQKSTDEALSYLSNNGSVEAEAHILGLGLCQKKFGNYSTVDSTNLCTASLDGHTCSCEGVLGEPLVQFKGLDTVLIGLLVEESKMCSGPNVFARISEFIHWINRKIHDTVTQD